MASCLFLSAASVPPAIGYEEDLSYVRRYMVPDNNANLIPDWCEAPRFTRVQRWPTRFTGDPGARSSAPTPVVIYPRRLSPAGPLSIYVTTTADSAGVRVQISAVNGGDSAVLTPRRMSYNLLGCRWTPDWNLRGWFRVRISTPADTLQALVEISDR